MRATEILKLVQFRFARRIVKELIVVRKGVLVEFLIELVLHIAPLVALRSASHTHTASHLLCLCVVRQGGQLVVANVVVVNKKGEVTKR